MILLGERTHTRRRYPAAVRDADGYAVAGTPTDSDIVASVQPAGGRVLERLPEGLRDVVTHVACTMGSLRTADAVGDVQADELVVDGEVFQVENVQTWDDAWVVTQAALRRVGP